MQRLRAWAEGSDWRRFLPVALTLIFASGAISVAVFDDDGDGKPDRVNVERKFKEVDPPGPTPPLTVDTDNQLQPDEQREAEESEARSTASDEPVDLHEDMRDETPPGVTAEQVKDGLEATEALADKTLTDPQPPAGAQAWSCPNHLVRNRSALNGPRVGTALHFTVSDPGSLNAIRGLFDTSSFGASSNFGIELAGRCETWVPRSEKAWAQGAANSAYFSIEIVTKDRSRESWLAAPIIKNGILAALVRDLNRSIGAPLKLVDPVGCTWKPGIVDHDRLECGNTHWDVGLNFPWDVFIKQVQLGTACGERCNRKKSLRTRHNATHRALRKRQCNVKGKDKARCQRLMRRNLVLHETARAEKIRLVPGR